MDYDHLFDGAGAGRQGGYQKRSFANMTEAEKEARKSTLRDQDTVAAKVCSGCITFLLSQVACLLKSA